VNKEVSLLSRTTFLATLLLFLSFLLIARAESHELLLLPSHSTALGHVGILFGHKGTNLLNGPGLTGSISSRTFQLQVKNAIFSSYAAGANSVSASALRSAIPNTGQLEFDVYLRSSGPGSPYINLGEYDFTNNNNLTFSGGLTFISPGASSITPGFSNNLSFTSAVYGASGGNTGLVPVFQTAHGVKLGGFSGSEKANQSFFNSLAQKSFQLGATHAYVGGNILGGEFSGTFYTGAPPGPRQFVANVPIGTPNAILAFGNNPLNNPAGVLSMSNLMPSSYLLLGNGVMRNLSAFQIAGTLTPSGNLYDDTFPFFLAGGRSPLNTLDVVNGYVLNNPASFLNFF